MSPPTCSSSRRSAGGNRDASPAASGCSDDGRSSTTGGPGQRGWPCSHPTASPAASDSCCARSAGGTGAGGSPSAPRSTGGACDSTSSTSTSRPTTTATIGGGKRRSSSTRARRLPRLPVIAGDCNDVPDGPGPADFGAAGWVDAWTLDRLAGVDGSTNWTAGERRGRPPTQRLDYVFVPPGWTVVDAAVLASRGALRLVRRALRSPPVLAVVSAPGDDEPTTLLDKIRKLLAKAEGTDNANEAEAFSAKAAQLIAEHRVDPEHVREALAHGALGLRRIALGRGAYVRARLALLDAVARNQDCEVVFETGPGGTTAIVAGYESDLDVTEVLYTLVARPGGEPDGRLSFAHPGGDAAVAPVVPVRLRQPRRRTARSGPGQRRGPTSDGRGRASTGGGHAPRCARPIGAGACVRGALVRASGHRPSGRTGTAVGLARRPSSRRQRRPRSDPSRRPAGVDQGRARR